MLQSNPSREGWGKAWPALNKTQVEIKVGPVWCQVVTQARRKNKKILPCNKIIQKRFFKLLTNGIRKSQQFSQIKYKQLKMRFFGDMAAWELKVKFQHEVNNLIFKYRMLTLEQNTQPNSLTFNYYPPCSIHAKQKWKKFRLLR